MLHIVVINGGRGAATLIPSILDRQGLHVTSVVNAYDDGKSTGDIRSFFGMLGPSDVRKVQQLMLPKDDPDYHLYLALFTFRYPDSVQRESVLKDLEDFASAYSCSLAGFSFSNPHVLRTLRLYVRSFITSLRLIEQVQGRHLRFTDCSLMNCIYAGAFVHYERNLEQAAKAIDRLFRLRGTVLPTSNDNLNLVALRENGDVLYSESEIVELRSNVRIERIYLLDHLLNPLRFKHLSTDQKRSYLSHHHCSVPVSSGVLLALKQADIIIYGAGTQHSSLYPTYMASGLASAIADNSTAFKVFITNIGADYETPSYKASDYLRGALNYLSFSAPGQRDIHELVDLVLVNKSHRKPDETYVEVDTEGFTGLPVQLLLDDFEMANAPGKHDGKKLIDTIFKAYMNASHN